MFVFASMSMYVYFRAHKSVHVCVWISACARVSEHEPRCRVRVCFLVALSTRHLRFPPPPPLLLLHTAPCFGPPSVATHVFGTSFFCKALFPPFNLLL